MNEDLCRPGFYHVFVRDLLLDASIGVYVHEHRQTQRVRVNVDLALDNCPEGEAERALGVEDLTRVLDYQRVAHLVRSSIRAGHIILVETLAERIANGCLRLDPRIAIVRVRVEKLDVFADAFSAGVTFEKRRASICPPAPIDSQ